MAGLVERSHARIARVVCCYDNIVITGTIPRICHAKGMTSFLYANSIRILDYSKFAAALGIRSARSRQNSRKRRVSASSMFPRATCARRKLWPRRLPGAVIIQASPMLSSMEACGAYKP